MGSRTALAMLGVLVLAGCADDARPNLPSGPLGTAAAPPPPPTYGPAACDNILLFEVADYGQTDPFLPPGFHPRDPQEFLNSPVSLGQAGVVFMTLVCESAGAGPLAASFVGIFIEAPIVEGVESAPLNFLELVRYGSGDEFGGALGASGWPVVAANVSLVSNVPVMDGRDALASVEDPEGTVARVAGTAAAPGGALGSPARFWHQDERGLSYIDYDGTLDPSVGSGTCEVRAGTPLSVFVGTPVGVPVPEELPVGDPTACLGVNGGEPLVVILQDLSLQATFHRFPGVQAG